MGRSARGALPDGNGVFAGTPYEMAPPDLQRHVVVGRPDPARPLRVSIGVGSTASLVRAQLRRCGVSRRAPGWWRMAGSTWKRSLRSDSCLGNTRLAIPVSTLATRHYKGDRFIAVNGCLIVRAETSFKVPDPFDRRRGFGRFVVRKSDRLQLREDGSDKNARFDPKQHPIRIIRNPDAGVAKFLVRCQFAIPGNLVQLKIKFDCRVGAGCDRHRRMSRDRDGREIRTVGQDKLPGDRRRHRAVA